jgi:hypothetical protein
MNGVSSTSINTRGKPWVGRPASRRPARGKPRVADQQAAAQKKQAASHGLAGQRAGGQLAVSHGWQTSKRQPIKSKQQAMGLQASEHEAIERQATGGRLASGNPEKASGKPWVGTRGT